MRPAIESEPLPLEFDRTGVAPVQVMRQRSLPVIGEIKSPAGEVNRTRELWLIVSDRGLDEAQVKGPQPRGGRWTSPPPRRLRAASPEARWW